MAELVTARYFETTVFSAHPDKDGPIARRRHLPSINPAASTLSPSVIRIPCRSRETWALLYCAVWAGPFFTADAGLRALLPSRWRRPGMLSGEQRKASTATGGCVSAHPGNVERANHFALDRQVRFAS